MQAVSLDSFLEGEAIDLVKVDVEGFEPAVFRGMERTLRRCSPVIVAEFAPGTIRHISGSDPVELLDLVFSLDYRVSVIDERDDIVDCGGSTDDLMAQFRDRGTYHLNLLMRKGDA